MPAEAASRRQVAMLPNLRAHRLAALRGVRAHVFHVHSARQAYSAEVSYEGREWLQPCLWKGASWRAWVGGGSDKGLFKHSPTDAGRILSIMYWPWK
jgi:hypothetical protein